MQCGEQRSVEAVCYIYLVDFNCSGGRTEDTDIASVTLTTSSLNSFLFNLFQQSGEKYKYIMRKYVFNVNLKSSINLPVSVDILNFNI